MRRQNEKKKDLKITHIIRTLSDQNRRYKLHRYKLTDKRIIYRARKVNCFLYILSKNFDDLIKTFKIKLNRK